MFKFGASKPGVKGDLGIGPPGSATVSIVFESRTLKFCLNI